MARRVSDASDVNQCEDLLQKEERERAHMREVRIMLSNTDHATGVKDQRVVILT